MYVQRDARHAVTGVFRVAQPGLAEEFLPNDHPDVVAYLNRPRQRVLTPEDLWNALLAKGVVAPEDDPRRRP